MTRDEVRQQWVKYRFVGKLVYGLTFLDLEEDRKQRLIDIKEGKTNENAHHSGGHSKH